ncbi:MAG: transcription antitermination factor NusB [Oscillospiraceae bacterium]|jgi:N utilization substance protein B|nr:transcription antitermination factor NusB [Oscillospiraceae bacterium]
MNRHQARRQAFTFVFESEFGNNNVEDTIEMAKLCRNEEIDDFARNLLIGIKENENIIEEHIEKNAAGWKKERLSMIALAILKVAIYEIIYVKNIPESVSINEAVKLAQKYGEKEEPSYINGVLGAFVRNLKKCSS